MGTRSSAVRPILGFTLGSAMGSEGGPFKICLITSITQRDVAFEDEERWITVGAIGPGSILLVVHTFMRSTTRKSFESFRHRPPSPHGRKA